MAIVPVYRLRAVSAGPYPRYRFSLDARPDPNPDPLNFDPDPKTRWEVDRVAFYAWSDPVDGGVFVRGLRPVYEFVAVDDDKLVRYYYSMDPAPPRGFTIRPYAAFWAYPDTGARAGAPVYLYVQLISWPNNFALSVNPSASNGWRRVKVAFEGARLVPIQVSVRRDPAGYDIHHWTFFPSTANLSYPCTLEFRRAPLSDWHFLALKILNGEGNFDRPIVTGDSVRVGALYAEPGRDFKYRILIELASGGTLVGDPEIKNQDLDGL